MTTEIRRYKAFRQNGIPNYSSLYTTATKKKPLGSYKKLKNEFTNSGSVLVYDRNIDQRFFKIEKELHELESQISKQPTTVSSAKIIDLPAKEYELAETIHILIKYEDDNVFAIMPEVELQTDGYNEFEAIEELKLEILDLFDTLNETPDDELHTKLLGWKKAINKLIKYVG